MELTATVAVELCNFSGCYAHAWLQIHRVTALRALAWNIEYGRSAGATIGTHAQYGHAVSGPWAANLLFAAHAVTLPS